MRMRWAMGALVLVLAGPAVGQDTAALDKLLCDALKDMHNKAADLYNAGDPNGCYHVFRGGLLTARPLLAHRPDVQQLIDQGMQAADQQASVPHRARQLHDTIEAVRTRLKPPARPADPPPPPASPMPAAPMPPAPPPAVPAGPSFPMPPAGTPPPPPAADTLWKRLGGEDGVTKIVDDWITMALADEKRVNFTRGGAIKLDKAKEAELKQQFVAYISSITNGTVVPTATRGMADVHKGMKITPAEFDAFVGILKTSLEKNNVTARDVDDVVAKVNATKKDVVAAN
jgi:truncated hemoglobin YjbI